MVLEEDSFTITVPGSATTISLRVVCLGGSAEEMVIDHLRVFGTTASASLPTVTTATEADVTATSATLGGNVTADGGATVTDRGIVWGTSSNPTTSDNQVQISSGTGTFSQSVTGLPDNNTIHVRAYAINSEGISYGNDISFSTPSSNTAPTVEAAIDDVTATYGDGNNTFSVFSNFQDTETADNALTYTVTGNTDNTVVTASSISSSDGNLTLDFGMAGTSTITVQASDGSLSVTDDFVVTVNKATPTLTFTNGTSVGINSGETASTLELAATSDADGTNTNPVVFSLVSGPATLNGSTLTFGSTFGTVRVQATQAESDNYNQGSAFQNIVVRRPRITVGNVEFFSFEQVDYGSRTYSVSGHDLVDNVSITAPSEVEISTNNTDFGNSIVLVREPGTNQLTGQPVSIFVRLAGDPSEPLDASYAIAHSSTDAQAQTAAVRAVLCEDNQSVSKDVCLIATTVNSTSIDLRWKPKPGSTVGTYEIWRHTSAPTGDEVSPGTLIVENLPSSTTTYLDDNGGSGLPPGTTYYYRVRWKD